MMVIIGRTTYCCGRCALWRRAVGCTMRATPSTVNCGRTAFDSLCEQWWPSHLSARVVRRWKVRRRLSELDRFRVKISTQRRLENRAAHYADGAIYGVDL